MTFHRRSLAARQHEFAFSRTAAMRLLARVSARGVRGGFCAAALAVAGAGSGNELPTPEAVIAQARAFLGGDAAIDAVTSIHFAGKIVREDGKSGEVDIIVRKPMQQRLTVTIEGRRETTALNGYDGWVRVDNTDGSDWQLQLLNAKQLRRLRANVLENIGFFKGLAEAGGSVDVLGQEAVDGIDCIKVAFHHGPWVTFLRYFDRATGRLVLTETDEGAKLTERGEIIVEGVRFPSELVTQGPKGTSTVTFEKIELNREFDDQLFRVPLLGQEVKE